MGNEKSIEVLGRTFTLHERPGRPYHHPAADWESPFQLGTGARQVTGYIAARYRERTFDGRGWVRNELPWSCLLHVDLDPLFHGVDAGDIDINTRDCKTAEDAVAAALGALKLLGEVAWGGALEKLEGAHEDWGDCTHQELWALRTVHTEAGPSALMACRRCGKHMEGAS